MAISVEGKVSIVTGATKGIGRGIAEGLAQHGSRLVIVSRHGEDCRNVAEQLGREYGVATIGVAADITKQEDIDRIAAKTIEQFGCIDVLVNNAGTAVTKNAEDMTRDDWDKVLDLNLKAVFFCAQTIGRQMIAQQQGKIINIASSIAFYVDKRVLPYAVSKAAVIQMTKALGLEWARHNVQVNALCPGYIITEINEQELSDERIASTILKRIPMRRFAQPEELVDAVLFLASDGSRYMTGQHMLVDGGRCIG